MNIKDDVDKLCKKHNLSYLDLQNEVSGYIKTYNKRIQIPITYQEIESIDCYSNEFVSRSDFFIKAAVWIIENNLYYEDDKILVEVKRKNGRDTKLPIYFSDASNIRNIYDFINKNKLKKSIFFRYAAIKYIQFKEAL